MKLFFAVAAVAIFSTSVFARDNCEGPALYQALLKMDNMAEDMGHRGAYLDTTRLKAQPNADGGISFTVESRIYKGIYNVVVKMSPQCDLQDIQVKEIDYSKYDG